MSNTGAAGTTAQNNVAPGAADGVLALGTNYSIGAAIVATGAQLTNNSSISSVVSTVTSTVATGDNLRAAVGVYTAQNEGEFVFFNNGSVTAQHAGAGRVYGVDADQTSDDVNATEELTVINAGTILAERTRNPTAVTPGNGGNVVVTYTNTTDGVTPVVNNLAVAAAIFSNEGTSGLPIENQEGATIEGKGFLAAGIYTGGPSAYIVNEGTIKYTANAGTNGGGGVAISSHQEVGGETEDGERRINFGRTTIINDGAIEGDIQIVDAQGLRFMASRLAGGFDPATAPLTSQQGRKDSYIVNNDEIEGTVYLGFGNHVFVNNGELEGGQKNSSGVGSRLAIDVDHRRNQTYTTTNPSGLPFFYYYYTGEAPGGDDDDDDDEGGGVEKFATLADFYEEHPERYFELETKQMVEGDVFVKTVGPQVLTAQGQGVNGNVTGGTVNTPGSVVVLKPHITGSGVGSTQVAASENSGFIEGWLAIGTGTSAGGQSTLAGFTTSSVATTTTITPVIDSVVHSGEWFLVARNLNGSGQVPEIEEDSYLVSWEARQNGANGSLVIGSTVASASTVPGLSDPGADAIDALLSGPSTPVGVGLQRATTAGQLKTAGEQLAPEVNNATQESAKTIAFLTGQYIDARLMGVGATGAAPAAGGGFAPPSGLGMKQADIGNGRMNAGASFDSDVYTGDYRARSAGWGHIFGAGLEQTTLGQIDGYHADIYGGLVGYDTWMSPGFRVGAAVGYVNTDISGSGIRALNSTTDDTYLASAYAALKGSGWYLSGKAGFAWHDYETARYLTVPVRDSATASHEATQFTGAAELGLPMHTGIATLTPVASISASSLDQDGYVERSRQGMALRIGDQQDTSVVSGLGVKALVQIEAGTFIEGRAIWLHELGDNNQSVTASFVAGGGSFGATGPSVSDDTLDIGIGMFAYSEGGMNFQINYDALVREEFLAHTGSLKVAIEY